MSNSRKPKIAMRRAVALAIAALAAAACATFAPQRQGGPAPAFVPPPKHILERGGLALVLSGGAARGYAHVGVIRVLERNGLRPDLIVGTSSGSVVGALYASGLSAQDLERAIGRLDRRAFSDFVLPGLGFFPGEMGFIKGDRLHAFIDENVRHHLIEDFPIRFAAVATDLRSGVPVAFNTGDVGSAVRASSAAPGIITPVEIDRRIFGDGQISSPLPVHAARLLGATTVIAVDVIYPPDDAFLYSAASVVFQAFTISIYRLKEWERAQADIVVEPDLGRTSGQWSFGERERLIAAGERAAVEALPRLKLLFERARVTSPSPAIPQAPESLSSGHR